MTQSITLEAESAPIGRPARVVLAIIATLVILGVMSLIELGVLAFLAVASSAMNHGNPS
ncbi:MAG TPA: hypothetical protein VHZ81_06610 [Galbitalea sp.]|jgi:hypothetical protein|nr:hypothetical protein [Galbitalea sp.]